MLVAPQAPVPDLGPVTITIPDPDGNYTDIVVELWRSGSGDEAWLVTKDLGDDPQAGPALYDTMDSLSKDLVSAVERFIKELDG